MDVQFITTFHYAKFIIITIVVCGRWALQIQNEPSIQ